MEPNNDKSIDENKNHHHTLMEELRETFEKLDTEFPLSGGETEEDLNEVLEPGSDTKDEKKKEHEEKKTSFSDDLDTEFPLSGGETER